MGTFVLGMGLWQQQDMINSGNARLIEIFIGIAALALLGQSAAIIGVAVGLLKAQKELKAKLMPLIEKSQELVTDLSPQIKQITVKTNTLIGDLTPQVKEIAAKTNVLIGDLRPQVNAISGQVTKIAGQVHVIAGHAEEISGVVRDKVNEFAPTVTAAKETFEEANGTVREANHKTQEQVDRVNGMVTSVLDATENFGKSVQHTVTQPFREASGVANGLKAGFLTLFKQYSKSKKPQYKAPSGTYEPGPIYPTSAAVAGDPPDV